MLRNLSAEMARNGVTNADLAKVINKTERKVRDSVAGKFEFKVSEAFDIRDRFFPNMTMEYLFKRSQGVNNAKS